MTLDDILNRLFPRGTISLRQSAAWLAHARPHTDAPFIVQQVDALCALVNSIAHSARFALSLKVGLGPSDLQTRILELVDGGYDASKAKSMLEDKNATDLDRIFLASKQEIETFLGSLTPSLVLHLTEYGWMSPGEADEWRTQNFGSSFQRAPDLEAASKRLPLEWTLPMIVAWILKRDHIAVAREWDEYRNDCTAWREVDGTSRNERLAIAPNTKNGWALETTPPATLASIVEAHGDTHPFEDVIRLPRPELSLAIDSLKKTLYGEPPIATAIRSASTTDRHRGKRVLVQSGEWFHLMPVVINDGPVELRNDDRLLEPLYHSVLLPAVEVMRIWPGSEGELPIATYAQALAACKKYIEQRREKGLKLYKGRNAHEPILAILKSQGLSYQKLALERMLVVSPLKEQFPTRRSSRINKR